MSFSDSTTPSDDANLKGRLSDVLRAFPEIKAAYLFGSHASGTAHSNSDTDIAVVTRHRLGRIKLDILYALAEAGLEQIDLAVLDNDDIVMRHEAVRQNRLLYARPEFDHGAYFSTTIRQYEDFEPYLALQRRAYKRRLEHGSS